jgi:hypothetical protein
VSDPTGTAGLRRAFLAEGNRRLARVRSLTHTMLVEHDLMQTRSEPVAQLLPHPGHRLPVFADWFSRSVNENLLGGLPPWWEKYLQRAYHSGLVAGDELVKNGYLPPGRSSLPAVYRELARGELAGIAAALVQQVSRQAGGAAIGKQKPQLLYRAVLGAIRKVGAARLAAFVNMMTVKLHNAARLEHFRGAGITQVGIIPELRELAKPSRFLKHDHAVHDAGISLPTGEAVEAVKKQWWQRWLELLGTYSEESAFKIWKRETQAQQTQLERNVAKFEAQLKAGTKAFVARRQQEGAAVEAARQQREKALEAARTGAVKARAGVVEAEARIAQQIPARLLAIGAEYVNVLTAGDDLVWVVGEDISEEGPYALDEAQGLIPAHPNCRCAFVPALTGAQVAEAA